MTFNKNNIHTKLTKICSVSFLSLMIAACTQTNPAQIEDISGSPNAAPIRVVTDTSSSGSYSPPPSNIGTKREVSSTQQIDNNSSSYSSSTTKDNGNVVTTTQEKIVYNRDYDEIPKSGYKGDRYTVKRGDTLFYIAWITGNDFRSLAAKNDIKAPYELNVGQVLDVSGGATVVVTQKTTTNSAGVVKPTTTTTTTSTTSKTQPPTTKTTTTTSTNPIVTTPTASNSTKVANITWVWPAQGKVIERFSNATKGIDIGGTLGEKIVSAANGRVVYAGNALPGYGNLIIVKHNDDYLTAYAHNQNILVKEQQDVKAGQQIATMGSTGTSSVRLHFEIRYKAQSVDPLKYLPKK